MSEEIKRMRSEGEMYDLILNFARAEKRVRGVILNGSRANPNAPKDKYQDFDIVFIVRDFDWFLAHQSFLDYFGERRMMQTPEAMRDPDGSGHFNWLILFLDGNRLDLTLIPIEKPELIGRDSQSAVLMDKDNFLPQFPPASDRDYYVKRPSELYYFSCCNDFWWCLQNVAKGIARDEMPYAMEMYDCVVRADLKDMADWYIGVQNDFGVSAGKMGKYYKRLLPPDVYNKYMSTYSDARSESLWNAIFAACGLFGELAREVGRFLGYNYIEQDEANMLAYLKEIRKECEDAEFQL